MATTERSSARNATPAQACDSVLLSASAPAAGGSIAAALDAVTNVANSYTMNSLAERQEFLAQRRREALLTALEAEEDALAEDELIAFELQAGANLDELHGVLDDLGEGKMALSDELVEDMVHLMTELRQIMPELPEHVVDEIKAVARPLRQAISEYQNRVELR